jgi:hypothetical protein
MTTFIVRYFLAFGIVLIQVSISTGQVALRKSVDVSGFNVAGYTGKNIKREILPGLRGDRQVVSKHAVPLMTVPVNTTSFSGVSYWMGSVTTQSYNRGKIGRYYYWDVQGNLQGSHLFLDVAGKGRRGLKLIFPRQRTFF